MQYYLLIKTHNITNLNYLCKFTERSDNIRYTPFKYKGSGKYWKRHLKVHGNNIKTKILYKGTSKKNFSKKALYWSHFYDVVNSNKFANLIHENGLDGGGVKGRKLTEEHKKKISLYFKGRKHTDETKEKIRILNLGRKRPDLSLSNKTRVWTKQMRDKLSFFAKNRDPIKRKPLSLSTKNKISISLKKYYLNIKKKLDVR